MQYGIKLKVPDFGTRRRRMLKNFINTVILPPGGGPGFDISTKNPQVVSVTPNSVSPVLAQDLVFSLSDYTDTMVASDFTVILSKTSEASFRKQLRVVSVDDAQKKMTVRFPGAASAVYTFKITGKGGTVSVNPLVLTLTVILEVSDYQPRSGSTLGGTLVTITGKHFGTVATDNPVKIGDNYCYVETTADTQITCRVGKLTSQ
jgi:hypothetical protein